ncbi:MAG: response regulator [Acidobacteria bacterium]|nr:response regulator [Acidobacteriota bacterium]
MNAPLKILLVEDSEDDAALAGREFRKLDPRVAIRRVQSREPFGAALEEGGWDLVVSDYAMPGFSGGEALRMLRARDSQTPFILLSGEIGEERAAELMRQGANDFIRKDRRDRLGPAMERELRDAELRRAHQQTLEHLQHLGQAIEQSGDAIVMTDEQGRITYANDAFFQATGFGARETLGSHPIDILGDPLDVDVHDALREAIEATGGWQGRFRARRKDGEVTLLESRISAIRGEQGQVVGYVGTHRDVTRQVELETHLEQAQRLEAIGTLAGGIAHDFNNILAAIRGFTEVALPRAQDDPKLTASLNGILGATDRARDLVQQILAFSRSKPQERRPVQVDQVLEEAIRFIRATVPSSISIKKNIGSRAFVLADPTELHRIVVNLCTNGVLAMRGGIGTLTLELSERIVAEAEALRHPGMVPGPFVRLRVKDDGCGMPPEVVARIFEPFFTTRPEAGGTGMGLAVVHGLLLSMHGGIEVTSQVGLGSTFDVLLPVHGQPGAGPTPALGDLQRGSGRILFVDDEPILCSLAEQMLGGLGYTVCAFTDPLRALERFRNRPDAFDLVVTDMTMPGMSGDALTTELLRLRPELPVLICSGYSDHLDEERAKALGVARFLAKPFQWVDMSTALRDLLHSQGA